MKLVVRAADELKIENVSAFVATAESGSFSQAAVLRGCSQSMLSRRVLELEEQLGARLFNRTGRGVLLTELGVALLNAGVHVLVEKPIAATVADAQAMIDAAKANNRVLMVGHVERFNPAVETVKRAIDGDEIISIQITRVGPFPPRMGEVGVVIDLAVHDIDIIRHLTGSEMTEVQSLLGAALRTGPERRITVDEIQKTVAEHFNLKQADLLSERRTRAIARPRQVAMYLCKQHTTRSYPDIGRRFGGRDHTTVLHGVRKIEELMPKDDQIARDVEALTRKLRG